MRLLARCAVALCAVVGAITCLAETVPAAETSGALTLLRPATTAREAQAEAAGAIPLQRLRPETAKAISAIVREPSLYRRLPANSIDCDPELFLFCLRNPETVTNIWELMGATTVSLKRTGDFTFHASDGQGTTSDLRLVYGTPELQVFYCDGYYEGPLLLRKLSGRAVAVMRTNYAQGRDGRSAVSNTLDVFLKLDNAGVDLVAKTLHPLFGQTVDANFLETSKFLSKLSRTAEKNGPGVANLAQRLNRCDEKVRQEFADVSQGVAERATRRIHGLANVGEERK